MIENVDEEMPDLDKRRMKIFLASQSEKVQKGKNTAEGLH
jgi:hypothetical protein